MPPRRLHFVVGTSLLTASLASGCGSMVITNPVPNDEGEEELETAGGTETGGTETGGTETGTETGA